MFALWHDVARIAKYLREKKSLSPYRICVYPVHKAALRSGALEPRKQRQGNCRYQTATLRNASGWRRYTTGVRAESVAVVFAYDF